MVHPLATAAPAPNADLPPEILGDYEEAAAVLPISPRAAAALLRLCVQKLCVHFGQDGRDINKDIGALVAEKKISAMLQQAMDTVRITGNEAVHPGVLDLRDDPELAHALFGLVNLIADQAITQPRQVAELFNKMPPGKKDGVAQRDGTPPTGTPVATAR